MIACTGVEALKLRYDSNVKEYEARVQSQKVPHGPGANKDLVQLQRCDPTHHSYKSAMRVNGYNKLLKWTEEDDESAGECNLQQSRCLWLVKSWIYELVGLQGLHQRFNHMLQAPLCVLPSSKFCVFSRLSKCSANLPNFPIIMYVVCIQLMCCVVTGRPSYRCGRSPWALSNS